MDPTAPPTGPGDLLPRGRTAVARPRLRSGTHPGSARRRAVRGIGPARARYLRRSTDTGADDGSADRERRSTVIVRGWERAPSTASAFYRLNGLLRIPRLSTMCHVPSGLANHTQRGRPGRRRAGSSRLVLYPKLVGRGHRLRERFEEVRVLGIELHDRMASTIRRAGRHDLLARRAQPRVHLLAAQIVLQLRGGGDSVAIGVSSPVKIRFSFHSAHRPSCRGREKHHGPPRPARESPTASAGSE